MQMYFVRNDEINMFNQYDFLNFIFLAQVYHGKFQSGTPKNLMRMAYLNSNLLLGTVYNPTKF